MSNKLSMRIATHALIAGLTLTTGGMGAAVLASPAIAAPADQAIDTTHEASLTIHKRASDDPTSWQKPTGEEVDTPPGEALSGAEFTVQKLNYDFSDPAQIAEAAKLTPATIPAEKLGDKLPSKTTGADGVAKFENLAVGAYLVKETKTPEGKVGVNPFIVYLPMTNAAGNGWNYDVHAYPKNTTQKLSKALSTVLPEGDAAKKNGEANVGDEIAYDVTAGRPAIDNKKTFVKFFQVYDKVPAGLTYVNDPAKRKLTIGGEEVAAGDYTVTEKEIKGQKYVFYTLSKAANEKLTDAAADANVVATFTFTVDKIDDSKKGETTVNKGGATQVTDNKTINPDNPDEPGTTPDYPDPDPENPDPTNPDGPKLPDPDEPGNETPGVEDTWVTVDFKKKSPEGNPVVGAKFNVYRCTKEGAVTGLDKGDVKAVLGDRVLESQKDLTSDDTGKVTINALRVRADDLRTANGGYCLVETKAPSGYELLPSPYFFRVQKSDVERKDAFNFEVEDSRSVGPKLPATGGMGVGLLIALGGLIIGAGAYFARRNTKAQA